MTEVYCDTTGIFRNMDKNQFIKSKLNRYGLSLVAEDKNYIKKLLTKKELTDDEHTHIFHLVKQMYLSEGFTHNAVVFDYITNLIQNFSSNDTKNIEKVIKLLSLNKPIISILRKDIDLHNLSLVDKYIIGAVLKEYNTFVNNKKENIGIYYYLIILTLGLIRNKYRKNDWKSRFVSFFNKEQLSFVSKVKYDSIQTSQKYFDKKSYGVNSDITNYEIGEDKKRVLNNFFKKSKIIKHELLKDYEIFDNCMEDKGKKKVYISLYDNILKNMSITRKQFRTFITMMLDIDENFSFTTEFNENVLHKYQNSNSRKDKKILSEYMKLYKDYNNEIHINFDLLKKDFYSYIDELWKNHKIKDFDKYNEIVYFINTLTKKEVLYKIGKNGRIYTTGNTFWNINKKVMARYLNFGEQQLFEVDLSSSIVNIVRKDLGLNFSSDNYGDGKYKDEIKMFIMYLLNGRKRDLRDLVNKIGNTNCSLTKIFNQINPMLKSNDIRKIVDFIIREHNYINILANNPKSIKEKLVYKYLKQEVDVMVTSLVEFKKLRPNSAFVYKFDGVYLFNSNDAKLFSALLEQTTKNIYGEVFPHKVEKHD